MEMGLNVLLIHHSSKTSTRRFQRRRCLHMLYGSSSKALPCSCSWTILISGFVSHRIYSLNHFILNHLPEGDDCHGFAETIALVGRALLTGLEILKNHQILKPYQPENGELRNISVVLAMFVEFARSWTDIGGDHYGETKWVSKVGQIAKE